MPFVLCLPTCMTVVEVAESKHIAGPVRGARGLFNVTRSTLSTVERLLPANQGQIQDIETRLESFDALKAESEQYRLETTATINNLVREVNSLTPVGGLLLALHL